MFAYVIHFNIFHSENQLWSSEPRVRLSLVLKHSPWILLKCDDDNDDDEEEEEKEDKEEEGEEDEEEEEEGENW